MTRITTAVCTVLSLLLCLFALQLRAASFECDRAATVVEQAVCDNFQLSVDDRVMSFLYSQRLQAPTSSRQVARTPDGGSGLSSWFAPVRLDEEVLDLIRQEQVDWLQNERRSCGGDEGCLQTAYSKRIDQLLEVVRVEVPSSASGNRINFYEEGAEKEALRLWASIFENIERHNLFPDFQSGEEYFARNGTAQHSRSATQSPVFYENTDQASQGPLDWGVNINYDALTSCIGSSGLSDIDWWGGPMRLDTLAQLNDCLEMYWVDQNNFGSGGIVFPRVHTAFATEADHPFRLAYGGLCEGFLETDFVCSDPSRRILIETVETMASWALSEGYIDEAILRELLWPWKENHLFNSFVDEPYQREAFERASLSIISDLSHMGTFPSDLDYGRCRFNSDDVMVCPTLDVGARGTLRVSGTTDICKIGDFEYQLERRDASYSLGISGPPFDYTLEYKMNISGAGTGPCAYSYFASEGGGQISIDFGAGCYEEGAELPKTMSVSIKNYGDGPIPASVLDHLAAGDCELQFTGQFGGRL
ncbi:MAG: hypothetical protein KC447_06805 [Rhodobacteraceae bacterium]|jgi:uncharacterized protein|nr:hypothetical protein [Paracoccaceae bacterium]